MTLEQCVSIISHQPIADLLPRNSKVALRFMTPEDTDDIIRWRNNPRVQSKFIYQKPFTRESHSFWIKNMIETGSAVQFIIMVNNTSIGSVYFRDINNEHHKAEYGIFIGEDNMINSGYGTSACKLACDYGFEVLKLHKIFLRVFASNANAIRSYEKSGFVREALLRDDVFVAGAYRDIILMAKLDPGNK